MLRQAFKEWAIVCRLLAEGRQAVILRKGGIAETSGSFQVEHTRFWLYPTYAHQQRGAMRPEAAALLEDVEQQKPPRGIVRLTHFTETAAVHRVEDLGTALALQDLHGWSEETIGQRFAYRTPGLFALPVRVYRAGQTYELDETPAYAGCKSWVVLERALATDGATPVLDDVAFGEAVRALEKIIGAARSATRRPEGGR